MGGGGGRVCVCVCVFVFIPHGRYLLDSASIEVVQEDTAELVFAVHVILRVDGDLLFVDRQVVAEELDAVRRRGGEQQLAWFVKPKAGHRHTHTHAYDMKNPTN